MGQVIDLSETFRRERLHNEISRVQRISSALIDALERDVARRRQRIEAALRQIDDDVRNSLPSDCEFLS